MAKCFHLCVMTAERTLLEGEAEYCHIPTPGGSVGVLANHAPMLCAMREGETLCRMEDGEEKLHLIMVDPHIPAGAKLC